MSEEYKYESTKEVMEAYELFCQKVEVPKLEKEIERLKEELKREREAVDYYSDPMNWYLGEDEFSNISSSDQTQVRHVKKGPISNTGGKKARETQKQREIKL